MVVGALHDRGLKCTKLNGYPGMHDVCRNERGDHMHKSYVSELTKSTEESCNNSLLGL